MKKSFIRQNRLREYVRVQVIESETEKVYRPAQNHFDLIKQNITDGITTTTGIFDDAQGRVPDVFDPSLSRFELAQMALDGGLSHKKSSNIASDGVKQEAE